MAEPRSRAGGSEARKAGEKKRVRAPAPPTVQSRPPEVRRVAAAAALAQPTASASASGAAAPEGILSRSLALGGAPPSRGDAAYSSVALMGTSHGQMLPRSERGRFEAAVGFALGDVRVHTDAAADQAARAVDARAVTFGRDVYFARGQYAPGSAAGDRLLAHELTHVAQHATGRLSRAAAGGIAVSGPGDASEQEARATEGRLGAGAVTPLAPPRAVMPSSPATVLARDPAPPPTAQQGSPAPPASSGSGGGASGGAGAGGSFAPPPAPGGSAGAAGSPTDPLAVAAAGRDEVLELKGNPIIKPSPALEAYIAAPFGKIARRKVRVRYGSRGEGSIPIFKADDGTFETPDADAPAYFTIPFHHPLVPKLVPTADPVLAVRISKSVVSGIFGWAPNPSVLNGTPEQAAWTAGHPWDVLLGWTNFKQLDFPQVVNQLKGGVFEFSAKNFTFDLMDTFRGVGAFSLTDAAWSLNAESKLDIPGLSPEKLKLRTDETGHLFGDVRLRVALRPVKIGKASFSGSVEAAYLKGILTIRGNARYASPKMTGEVTLMATTETAAWETVAGRMGAIAPAGLPKGDPTRYAVFGWGVLDFRFNDWLTGRAEVIVDPDGYITSQGEIRPAKEVTFLTDPKYGVKKPIWKDSGTFPILPLPWGTSINADVGGALAAHARLGPGRLNNPVLEGSFSTRPDIRTRARLAADLSIAADAGIELRLTGGLSFRLIKVVRIAHAYLALTGTATLHAQAIAQPEIGLRESTDDPEKDEYYVKMVLKAAGELVLGLQGKFGAKILGFGPEMDFADWETSVGEIGMAATIDYVIGSKKAPTVTVAPASFDRARFVGDLLHRKLPKDSGDHQQEADLTWEDLISGGSSQAPPAPKKPGAPAGGGPGGVPPAPAKELVREVDMDGQTHTMTLAATAPPEIFIESDKGKLSAKAGRKRAAIEKQIATVPAADAALLEQQQRALDGIIVRDATVEAAAAELGFSEQLVEKVPGFAELDQEVEQYAKQFGVKDLDDAPTTIAPGPSGGPAPLEVGEGGVGSYDALLGPSGDNLTPHHMPQSAFLLQKAPTMGVSWSHSRGICLNMYQPLRDPDKKGRHGRTRTYGGKGRKTKGEPLTPLEALEWDVADVEGIYRDDGLLTPAIQSSISRVKSMNFSTFPGLFGAKPPEAKK